MSAIVNRYYADEPAPVEWPDEDFEFERQRDERALTWAEFEEARAARDLAKPPAAPGGKA